MYLNYAARVLAASAGIVTWICDEVQASPSLQKLDFGRPEDNPNPAPYFPGSANLQRSSSRVFMPKRKKYVPSSIAVIDSVSDKNGKAVINPVEQGLDVAPEEAADVGVLAGSGQIRRHDSHHRQRALLLDECRQGCPQEVCDACGPDIYPIGEGRNNCTDLLLDNCGPEHTNDWLCCQYGCDADGNTYASPVEAAYFGGVFASQYCAALDCLYADNKTYDYCYACQAYPAFCDGIRDFCEGYDEAYPGVTCYGDETGDCECSDLAIAKSCAFAAGYGCPGTEAPEDGNDGSGSAGATVRSGILLSIAAGGAAAASMLN
mmetsp:Transcript_10991/g.24599  ORF Transcript_10991/g.24599 Transcript_10991/m.24599 type:complete len:319 (-) Transcript_10991:172-1128(-)